MTQRRLLPWLVSAVAVASVAAVLTIFLFGAGTKGTIEALRVTGRLSFLLFWLAYAGGVLARLHVPVLSAAGRFRREFGLSFAAAHAVHVILILWLVRITGQTPLPLGTTVIDAIGVVWLYALVGLSVDRLRQHLNPRLWYLVFNIALEYIAFVFLWDFLILPLQHGHIFLPSYTPFAVLLVAAAVPRWKSHVSSIVQWIQTRIGDVKRMPSAP